MDDLHFGDPSIRTEGREPLLTAGTFLTFAQFVYVAVQTFSSQLVWTKGSGVPRWRKNQVPIKRWMVQVVLFFAVSLSEC